MTFHYDNKYFMEQIVIIYMFRKNNSPGESDEDHEDIQACQTLRRSPVSHLHPQPSLQRTRTLAPHDRCQSSHGEAELSNLDKSIVQILDLLYDIFRGEGSIAVDLH